MKTRLRISKENLTKILAQAIFAIGLIALLLKVLTNSIDGLWNILLFFPIIGVLILYGFKESIIGFGVVLIGLPFWMYLEFLQEKLTGDQISRWGTISGRISVVIIGLAVYIVFRWLFFQPIIRFFQNLWEMISIPRISRALLYLIISYTSIATMFGIAYASIYVFVGTSSFHSEKPLYLLDFIYYSVFVPTTLGYPDISPVHWLAKFLTLLEFLFGITVIVIYLGVIVSTISEHFSKREFK